MRIFLFKTLTLFIIITVNVAHAQESFVVNGESANVRKEPNSKSEILGRISSGEVVALINKDNPSWWLISYYGTEGYVYSKLLMTLSESEQYKDWLKESANTGDNPNCENIIPEYDLELDNELLIHVGQNTDVVVKLMNNSGTCIRIAYIKAGDDFSIRNIPEGIYDVKIAYGKDFRKYTQNGQCIVKFIRDAIYEKADENFDFYKVKKPDTIEGNYKVEHWIEPSFELSLNVEFTGKEFHDFDTNKITETEFNK